MNSASAHPPALHRPRPLLAGLPAALAFTALIVAQAYSIETSPADADMGHLQKIMYVHVPAAWMTFLSFFVVLVFSVRYLWRRNENDDLLAAAAAEVGATFNGLTLMLGMIWGRPAWGVWWVWDARLTSTLVLFLIFVGYLALRAFVDDAGQRARWSAAVGAKSGPIAYRTRWSKRKIPAGSFEAMACAKFRPLTSSLPRPTPTSKR